MRNRTRWYALSLVGLLTACAGGGTPSTPPVPVYFSADEVPCAYVEMGTIREEALLGGNFERLVRQVLGRAGARYEADAVLTSDPSRGPLTVVRVDGGRGDRRDSGAADRITLSGELLRYTDPECTG